MDERVRVWLEERRTGVPPTLASLIANAVGADEGPIEDVVRRAADRLITQAIVESTSGDAGRLLAADALITYACEAMSERDPGGLARLS